MIRTCLHLYETTSEVHPIKKKNNRKWLMLKNIAEQLKNNTPTNCESRSRLKTN